MNENPKNKKDLKPNFIRQWRKIKGLTMDELVAKAREHGLDTTQPTISRIERGVHPWSQSIIECVSTVLEVEPWELLQDPISREHAKLFQWLRGLNEKEIDQAKNILRAVFPGIEVDTAEPQVEIGEDDDNVVQVDFAKELSMSNSNDSSKLQPKIKP